MCLLRLPEKEKRYQSWPTYWKTNFSLSSRKENLSPQEQFALRAEQRLEIAQGNCTAMLSQIREELNTPTDNEQLLRLKRMSKSPHSNPLLRDLAFLLSIRENLSILLKTVTSWAQRDKTLQEKVTSMDTSILVSFIMEVPFPGTYDWKLRSQRM